MKRKPLFATIIALIMLFPGYAFADATYMNSNIVRIDDDYYLETVIEDDVTTLKNVFLNPLAQGKTTKTKSKTIYCKNSSGTVMWYVTVTGSFIYGNGSAKCTKSTCTAKSKNKSWKVIGKSSSKSGNKASAYAKCTHYLNGIPAETISRTVTLKCSPTGVFT